MTEIEKAIEYFEDAVLETDEIITECSEALQKELTEQKEHFVIALASLQEKLERGKGCEYCNCDVLDVGKTIKNQGDKFALLKNEEQYHLVTDEKSFYTLKIYYCPMCGKQLERQEV